MTRWNWRMTKQWGGSKKETGGTSSRSSAKDQPSTTVPVFLSQQSQGLVLTKVKLFQHQLSLTNQSVCCQVRRAENYLWPSGRNPSQRRRTVATTGAAVNSQSRYHCEGLEQTLDKVIDQMALKGIFVLTKNSSCINAAAARNHGEDQTSIYETHLEIIALFFKAIAKDTLQSSGIWSCTSH